MFKKLIIRRNQDNRILSIYGFCSLLPLNIGKEIFSNLKLIMKYPASVRSSLFETLYEILPNIEDKEILNEILKILLPTLKKYMIDQKIDFYSLFEDISVEPVEGEKKIQFIQKESIHKLIQCLIQVNSKKINSKILI